VLLHWLLLCHFDAGQLAVDTVALLKHAACHAPAAAVVRFINT
jgi:hypothetical protein